MITFYRLFDKEGKSYIGQTTNLYERLCYHKCKKNKCMSKYFKGVFEYEILEECENLSKEEIKKKEGEYILKYNYINYNTNNRTYETWRQNNMELFKKHQKNSYDKLGKERNKRTKIQCECGGHYVKRNKKIHEKTKKHINFLNKSNGIETTDRTMEKKQTTL